MDNSINNVSFKANIKTLTKIKNKSAFVEAKNIFQDATKNHPNDSVYITKNTLGETTINLANTTNNIINRDIGTNNIDKQIEEMGIKKFADKLVKMFNALKLHDDITTRLTNIESEVFRLNKMMEINRHAAENWKTEGKQSIANRYTILANNNQGKIKRLQSEAKKFKDEYNKKIEDLTKQYPELIQLKIRK